MLKYIEENWRKKSMEFFLNKEKDQVMKTKEKLCQERLFRNLKVHALTRLKHMHAGIPVST